MNAAQQVFSLNESRYSLKHFVIKVNRRSI